MVRSWWREPAPLRDDVLIPDATGDVRTADGTTLRYQRFGSGFPVVIANGIGILYPGLLRQIEHLRGRYEVVTWDYRGLEASRLGYADADLSMPAHAADLLALLDHLGIERAVLVGWSMGVQVNLEVLRARPGVAAGFVALFGAYGRPFANSLPAPLAEGVARFWEVAARFPAPLAAFAKLGPRLPQATLALMHAGRWICRDTDRAVFLNDIGNVATADTRSYVRTMVELARHDASDVLPEVTTPTLIIAGERDVLTPPHIARQMAERMPSSECVVLEGATHYGLIEPQPVNELLDAFLAKILEPDEPT